MDNRYFRLSISAWVVVFALAYSAHTYCQSAPPDKPPILDAQMRQKLIESIIRELQTRYVVPKRPKSWSHTCERNLRAEATRKSRTRGSLRRH